LDGFKVCFHDNPDNCPCRKPKPGLILAAAAENDLDLRESWMIGDRASDVKAGQAAGCRTIFLDFNYAEPKPENPNFVCRSLQEAIGVILEGDKVASD
jgi:D-glycero-D-manno-heptose 1,7-bisphosphate phosphatase